MPMPIEAKEVAVGDWSPNYGTVSHVSPHLYRGNITTITIEFFNGKSIQVKPEEQLDILQAGSDIIHNGMPQKSGIRPGLGSDHEND
jgi:hypothetical protein